jgi:hypothetical protein
MEDREQEYRCRRAAWAIAWGEVLFAGLFAWDFVIHGFQFAPGWWVALILEVVRRPVRRGERLGAMTFLLGYLTFSFAGYLWMLYDGRLPRLPLDASSREWLAGVGGAQFLICSVAASFTWIAWRHQVRASLPERTPAQIARHRQLARLVLITGLVATVGLVAAGIAVWQDTGSRSDALKCIAFAAFVLLGTQVLVKRTEQGRGVAVTTGLLIPGLVVAPVVGIVGLFLLPFGSQSWVLAATWLLVSLLALVISIRALLGGEKTGQGDAG